MSCISGQKTFSFLQTLLVLALFLGRSWCKSQLIELSEKSKYDVFSGEWMIMFYAPWCPACQSVKPTWESFASQWSEDLEVNVASVNINDNPGLSGQFLVFQLPTIYHIKDGSVRQYTGSRSQDAFVNWVNDKSWRNIDPVEWYKSPNSIQMKAVGQFFRFANLIKEIHEELTEDYEIPTLAVYGIFAVVTILTGLLLGMLLVVICDCFFPPKPLPLAEQTQYSKVEITNTKSSLNKKGKQEKSTASKSSSETSANSSSGGDNTAAGLTEGDNSAAEDQSAGDGDGDATPAGDDSKPDDKSDTKTPETVRKRKPRKE